jgi:hypothetical protein
VHACLHVAPCAMRRVLLLLLTGVFLRLETRSSLRPRPYM